MQLEENMYVRTEYGIDKIKDIVLNGGFYEDSGLYLEKNGKILCGKEVMKDLKASHNIIDLIEVGDYVNGKLVAKNKEVITTDNIYIGRYLYEKDNSLIGGEEDIKSIVTKEAFESMSYKVGE